MKESWTRDPQQIQEELASLVKSSIPLKVFYRKNTAPVDTVLQHVCDYEGEDYVVLKRPAGWQDSKKNYVLYKIGGQPTRGFAVIIHSKSENQLAAPIPKEIFQINQRRHTRIDVPDSSKAILHFDDPQKKHTCLVKDLSLSGVSLEECPTAGIKEGDEVGSVKLELAMSDYESEMYDITIPAATVARLEKNGGSETLLGLSFSLDGDTQEQLHKYLDLRIWESIDFEE